MRKLFLLNFGLAGALLIILPNFSPLTDIPYNSKRIFQIGFLVLIVFQFVVFNNFFKELKNEWNMITARMKYVFYAVAILCVISSLFSSYPIHSFLEVGVYSLLLIFIFITSFWYKKYPDLFLKTVGVILSLMIILYFVRFSINYIYNFIYPSWPVWPNTRLVQILVNGEPFYPEPFLGFIHPRFLNHLHTWSLPLIALFIVNMPKKYWAYRTLLYFFTGFWWMLVFASDARGTMLASILSLILVAVLFRTRIKEWIKTYLITSTAGLLSYLFFFKLIIPKGSRTILSRFSDSGRLKIWNNALDLFKENPFLGAGPMHYADISNGYGVAHPHNFYLQVLSEWGIISFILLATVIIFIYSKWIGKCNKSELKGNKLNIQAALTASLSAGLMHSFLSGLLHTPLCQIMAAIVFGWAIGFYQLNFVDLTDRKSNEIKYSKVASIMSRILILFITLFVLLGTFKTYKDLPESRNNYIQQEETTKFSPRFWDHGNIGLD